MASKLSKTKLRKKLTKMDISFAGCGFLGIYHVGVISCLSEHAPHLLKGRILGTSAGGIAAAAFVEGVSVNEMANRVVKMGSEIRRHTLGPLSPSSNLRDEVYRQLDEMLADDAHIRANEKLIIAFTRVYDGKGEMISHFRSKQDLIEVIAAASWLPVFSGWIPPMYNGYRVVDGWFSENRPVVDERTITVSPFSGNSDICPQNRQDEIEIGMSIPLTRKEIDISRKNLYLLYRVMRPPQPEVLHRICKRGYKDAMRFLQEKNWIYCDKCVEDVKTLTDKTSIDGAVHQAREVICLDCKNKMHSLKDASIPASLSQVFEVADDSATKRLSSKLVRLATLPVTVPASIAVSSTTIAYQLSPIPSLIRMFF